MRSKELEEERSGLIEKCRQLEETLADGSKESEERGENELEKELALAKEQRTEATEEAKIFKEKFKELEMASAQQVEEQRKQWESKLEEKDQEVSSMARKIETLNAEAQSL